MGTSAGSLKPKSWVGWVALASIPLIVLLFRAIGGHYKRVKKEVAAPFGFKPPRRTHTMVVLVGGLNRGALEAFQYARSLAPDRIMGLSVIYEDSDREKVTKAWTEHDVPFPLELVYSPYRNLTRPVLRFLSQPDPRQNPLAAVRAVGSRHAR